MRPMSALAVLAALALMPCTAFAQGAADNQYQDPFGGSGAPPAHHHAATPQRHALSPTPPVAHTAPAATAPRSTPATATATATHPSGTPITALPRTGVDVGEEVAIAVALLVLALVAVLASAPSGPTRSGTRIRR